MQARLPPPAKESTRTRQPVPDGASSRVGADAASIVTLQSLVGNSVVARALAGSVQRENGVHQNPFYRDPGTSGTNPFYQAPTTIPDHRRDISEADAKAAREIADQLEDEAWQSEYEYAYRGLGGGGAGFLRSSEVRKFRGEVKQSARQQAYADIGKETSGKPGTATSEYQKMVGGNIAYKGAKESVDEQLKVEAQELLTADFSKMWRAAKTAAEASFAAKSGDRKAALKAAKEAVKEPLKVIREETRRNKDAVVGKRTGADEWQMTPLGKAVADRAAQKVEVDEVGKKSLALAIDAPTMNKGLRMIGGILDNVIPGAGETISLKIDVTIPTGVGVSVVIGVQGVAARGLNGATTAGVSTLGNPKRLEIMAKFSVGAGAEAIGVKSTGSLGFMVRSGSDAGTEAAITALSYAAYRAAKPEAFADLWAPEDKMKVASSARQRAEMWAAMVEEQIFSGGAAAGTYGDVGASVGLEVGLNVADVAKFGISLGETVFSRYNEESMKASLGSSFAAPVASDADAKSRREKASGAKKLALAFGASTKFGAGGYSVELALSASGANLQNWGVEITAGIGTAGSGAAKAADVVLNQFVAGIGELLKKCRDGFAKSADQSPGVGGIVAQMPADGAVLIDVATKNALTSAIEKIGATKATQGAFETPLGKTPPSGADALKSVSPLDVGSSLQFALTFGRDDGKWVGRIEVRSVRGIDIGGGSPLAVSASKTTRLFALGIEEKRVVAEFVGGRID